MEAQGGQAMHPFETELRVQDHALSLEREAANERLARAAQMHHPRSRPDRAIRKAVGQALVRLGASIAAVPKTDEPCGETRAGNAV
jgi:hypothetical protein